MEQESDETGRNVKQPCELPFSLLLCSNSEIFKGRRTKVRTVKEDLIKGIATLQ